MKNNNFDLLRLFASLSVVLTHSLHHLYHDFGYEAPSFITAFQKLTTYIPGVPIFFLISGYLIYMSYNKNSDFIVYTKNRILRIYPALFVNIFFGILILYYFGFLQINTDFFKWLFAQLSIVQFYNAEMFRNFGVGVINGSLWTISVELTFYIILPILVFIYRKNKYIVGSLFILSFIFWIYDQTSSKTLFLNKLIHSTIVPYLFLFIIGMGFFQYHNKIIKYIENKFIFWFIIFVCFHTSIFYFDVEMNLILYIIKWSLFSFMIFSFAFSFHNVSEKLLKGNDYTYGIYIYHMLVINIFVHMNYVGEIKYLILVFLLSIILGIMSWYFIEKPCLKLKKHSLFRETHQK